jgi:hypothetical protein
MVWDFSNRSEVGTVSESIPMSQPAQVSGFLWSRLQKNTSQQHLDVSSGVLASQWGSDGSKILNKVHGPFPDQCLGSDVVWRNSLVKNW